MKTHDLADTGQGPLMRHSCELPRIHYALFNRNYLQNGMQEFCEWNERVREGFDNRGLDFLGRTVGRSAFPRFGFGVWRFFRPLCGLRLICCSFPQACAWGYRLMPATRAFGVSVRMSNESIPPGRIGRRKATPGFSARRRGRLGRNDRRYF
jgi:hypothetical protein